MVRISPRSGPSLVSQARSGCHVQWAAEDETVRRHRRPSGCESEHAGRHGRTGEPGVLPSTGPRVGHGWRLGSNSRWRLERSREGTSAAQERSLVPVRAQSGLQEGRHGHREKRSRGLLQGWMTLSTWAGRGALGQQAVIPATEVGPASSRPRGVQQTTILRFISPISK